jgi:hypothetical protein
MAELAVNLSLIAAKVAIKGVRNGMAKRRSRKEQLRYAQSDDIASKLVMLECSDSVVFLLKQIPHKRRFFLWFSLRNRSTA